ncbi:MAG: hypothetical protein VKN13_02170 [Cyanobacteriota bacterium]|nr:hypothetical protein [Cyanobacteriota bacterium]
MISIRAVHTQPVLLGLNTSNHSIANELGSIAASALLTREPPIHRKRLQRWVLITTAEDPQSKPRAWSKCLSLVKLDTTGGGVRKLNGRSHNKDQR